MAVAAAHVCVWGSGLGGGSRRHPDCQTQLQGFVSATRQDVEDVSARKAAAALGQWQRAEQPAKLSNNHIKAQQAVVQGDESEICVLKKKKKCCELCITSSVCGEPVIFNVSAFEAYKGWTKKKLRGRDLKVVIFGPPHLACKSLLDATSAEPHRFCHGRAPVTSPWGEPTSPGVVVQRCSRLHQSRTQASISIFTWELSESRIWSTITPAREMWASERRNNICVIGDVGSISAAPQAAEETVTLLSAEIQTDLGRASLGVVTFQTELTLYHQVCAHEANLNKNRLFQRSLQQSVFLKRSLRPCPKIFASTMWFAGLTASSIEAEPTTSTLLSPASLK